jgi:hypothetical protein
MGSTSRSITHRQVTVGNLCNICIVFVLLLFKFIFMLWACR